jgi:hypothetical protein
MDSTMRDGKNIGFAINRQNKVLRPRTIENGYPLRYPIKQVKEEFKIIVPIPIRKSKTVSNLMRICGLD